MSVERSRCQIETPVFRFNHPKNYFAVPIAEAAEKPAGALLQAYVVRGVGGAKKGAETLGLLDSNGELTDTGTQVAEHAEDQYGGYQDAIESFETLKRSSRRFCDVDGGIWEDIAIDVVSDYQIVSDVTEILRMCDGEARLPTLGKMYLQQWPEMARAGFLKGKTEKSSDFGSPSVYRSPITCQLKTILYHCNILTERGSDSAHLIPQTDVWEITPEFEDYYGRNNE